MNNTPQNKNTSIIRHLIALVVLCTIILPFFGNSASEAYVPELQNRIKSVEQKNTPIDLKKWFFNPYYHWVLRYYYDEIASDITVFRNSDMDDISYTYDANGNLKQRITTAGIEEIIYNPRNQPIAIVKGGEKVASFTYDSIGMRNRSLDLETGKQQDYLREGRKVLAEMDGKGANRKVYRYGNGPMGYVANGLPQFTSRDPVGSPFAVSSSTGKLIETRQYEPFGESTALMDSVDDYPNVHIHFQQNTIADSTPIGDIGTIDPDPKTGTVTTDLPLAGAAGETYEPELFLTIGDDPETTHLPVHQVPLIMVTDLPPPYMTLEADTLVFEPTTTDPVTYTLTIEPVGNTFNDVIITIPLPKTVEYNVTISEQKPIHDTLTNTLTWDYPQLIGTQTIEFTITVDFIKNYDTWLDLQATLTATELFGTNRLSNTASTAIFNNGLVALITPKADFDPTFTNKPTAYALLDSDPLATSQSITCDYKIKLLGETSQNTQTFIGKEIESHTGLIYFGARFYDPVIGRFISEDPYSGSVWDPLSLMPYAYAYNNPLVYVDPDGNSATIVGGVAGFFWGFGQMAIGMGRDIVGGTYHGTSEYLGVWGRNIVGGAEIGASVDLALVSGGLAATAAGGLGAAGFDSITFAGRSEESLGEYAKDQVLSAAGGAAFGGVLYKAIPAVAPWMLSKGGQLAELVLGREGTIALKELAVQGYQKVANQVATKVVPAMQSLDDAVMSQFSRESLNKTAQRAQNFFRKLITKPKPPKPRMIVTPKKPAEVILQYDPKMPRVEFIKKANALKKLGEEAKLFKAPNPVSRDPRLLKQYRQEMIEKIWDQYGSQNPEFANHLIDRVTRKMSPDHVWELQLGGPDVRSNLKWLDRYTNEQIGMRQIWPQIKDLDDYTPIIIKYGGN